MTIPSLGRVASLFPHIEKDWWKKAYNEMYLYTDGDCVEVPAITEAECNDIIGISSVQQLLKTQESSIKVLDLCCGQGRHSINLAKRFPSVNFYGIDQSTYLLDLARKRAIEENVQSNVTFQKGDLRRIPASDCSFDLVILLGNSFGHCNDEGDLHQSGWEWLEGKEKLLACRERELSPDKTLLASREIVIDLEGPSIRQDLFYSVRLYDLEEMDNLLQRSGLFLQAEDGMQITATKRDGPVDMGMMERRQLIVAQKPVKSTAAKPPAVDALEQDADIYVHPNLTQSYNPHKGRLLQVSAFVSAGTMILADTPYALIPSADPSHPDASICSNLKCRQQVSRDTHREICQRNCIRDVVWCDNRCRTADQARHDFECAWLKNYGESLRQNEGQYAFAMLWTVMRLLAGRYIELQAGFKPSELYSWEDRFKRGWDSIEILHSNRERWPQTQILHWKRLVEVYLTHDNQSDLSVDDLVDLICKEESNSFGLYPSDTGIFPIPDPPIERGVDYGLGIYPRASIVNHSCIPNVIWRADNNGRMVLTTSKDLAAGDECFICYFDLCKYVDFKARQKLLREDFLFSCAFRDDYHPLVTIQFGHNDQKPAANISLSQYTRNLERFVTEASNAGATPILVTPLSRRNYDKSTGTPRIVMSLANETLATIIAAHRSNAAYIDLNKTSTWYLNAIGPENAFTYNLNPADYTHLNVPGSILFGGIVAELITQKLGTLEKSGYLRVNDKLKKNVDYGIYYWP
ncbi:CAZyme family CE12 [Penicillium roqueforti]|nr:CAZyme family CE12 [Penicillium roqueforti]KAI3263776.1 CAZyme family CE12 [Penicillium roqueforti]